MRKQIVKILQQKPLSKQRQTNGYKSKFKGEPLSLNNLQDDKAIYYSCQTNDQLAMNYMNRSKGSQNKEPKHLLNKIKAVERITLTPFQETKLQESESILRDARCSRLALDEKLKAEKERKIKKELKAEKGESLRLLILNMKEQTERLQLQSKAYENENITLKAELSVCLKQIRTLKQKIIQLQEQNIGLRSQIQNHKIKINQVREDYRESESFSLLKLTQLQEYIEDLKAQKQDILRQNQKQATIQQQLQKKHKQLQLNTATLKVVIFPAQDRETSFRQKNNKDLQLNLLEFQKKYIISINKLKKQHEQEISNLKQTFYKNLNFYRELIKKSAPNSQSDTLKQQALHQQVSQQSKQKCFNVEILQQQMKDKL